VQLVVEPLELAGEQFGYLVLEGDVRDGQAYLELRRHLGSSLGRMAHGRELRRLYAAEKKRGMAEALERSSLPPAVAATPVPKPAAVSLPPRPDRR
jgi:hypothetical protein